MADIVLDKVSKQFADGTWAVHEVDLEIGDGEFFILVGPSGCGKSTLLNLIAGLEEISAGELRVAGRRLNEVDAKDRNMAMVFQSYAIYPHMSVRENLAFPLKMAKLPVSEIEARVNAAAAMLNLTPWLERRPGQLSGGQRQRVAMGRAVVRKPQAFLLDEPLSNLDAQLRLRMRTEIARLQKNLGTTMVYVTHDQTEALTLGDRVAVLSGGRVQQVDTPAQLYHRPANLFVAGFIGSPPMNLLPAQRLGDGLVCHDLHVPLPESGRERLPEDEHPLVLGVRPEHWQVLQREETNRPGLSVIVDVLEWTGPDLYAHLRIKAAASGGEVGGLQHDFASDVRADTTTVVARIEPASEVAEGQTLRLGVNTRHLHMFDAQTGRRLF